MKKIPSVSVVILILLLSGSGLAETPKLNLKSPLDFQVFQRAQASVGTIDVVGNLPVPARAEAVLEVCLDEADWKSIAVIGAGQSQFSAPFEARSGGWYQLAVRVRVADDVLAEVMVGDVGIGEVFVIAGQSNSANHGAEKQQSLSGMVSTFDGKGWRIAHDPQPGASGRGGSFVPPFADAIADRFKVPVGIVSTGVGATSVREWLPRGSKFPNPPTILNKVSELPNGEWQSKGGVFDHFVARAKSLGPHGFRAVLWHQGESDANQRDPTRTLPGSLYQKYLTALIERSREEVGWKFPWFVAQASYHTPDDPGSEDIRSAQQALWISGVALEGPDSDALGGENRDNGGKGVHFSGPGLRAHGKAWAERVAPWLETQLSPQPVKVFILAGQSNMEGQGVVSMDHEQYYNGGKGNLVWSMRHSASKEAMKHLRDADGEWVKRDDVEISFKAKGEVRRGGLTIGYTGYGGSSHIGPELQFGHVLGEHFDEPVLLIKTAWGGKSLQKDFRPPSSGGETGAYYNQMIAEVRAALGDEPSEIVGFAWMQGWNDMVSKEATAEYETNLVNFVNDVRAEFELPNLPFVIGELGNGGPAKEGSGMYSFREAQKRAVEQIKNAVFVPTAEFARPKELSPNVGHGHHWFGNAESYFLVGDALARAMVKLLEPAK
jgi:hypothetical protein